MNILEHLYWRYAVREFDDKKVSQDDIDELIEAVRLTPSSYGLQPYKLLVIESDEVRNKLLPFSMGQTKVKESSHLFVFAYEYNFNENHIDEYFDQLSQQRCIPKEQLVGFMNHVKDALITMPEEGKREWCLNQTYIALGNLLTTAALKKIDTCPIGGFLAEGFDEVLGLKEKNLSTAVICAVGYRSTQDETSLLPKIRTPQAEFLERI